MLWWNLSIVDFIFIIFPVSFYYWWDDQRRRWLATVRKENSCVLLLCKLRIFLTVQHKYPASPSELFYSHSSSPNHPPRQNNLVIRLAIARFSSPWLGTKSSQSYMITQRWSCRHRNDRMTHRLSHMIVEDGPGCGAMVLTSVMEAAKCREVVMCRPA